MVVSPYAFFSSFLSYRRPPSGCSVNSNGLGGVSIEEFEAWWSRQHSEDAGGGGGGRDDEKKNVKVELSYQTLASNVERMAGEEADQRRCDTQ